MRRDISPGYAKRYFVESFLLNFSLLSVLTEFLSEIYFVTLLLTPYYLTITNKSMPGVDKVNIVCLFRKLVAAINIDHEITERS